jgi:hypothetical protein
LFHEVLYWPIGNKLVYAFDQREVEAAFSALPLFHELLGFRFRGVKDVVTPRVGQASSLSFLIPVRLEA